MKEPSIWWDFDHTLDRREYVERVLGAYCQTPTCSGKPRREDRRLAYRLYDQQIPLALIEAAFSLAAMRRIYRSIEAAPLDPIRSLHYFLPIFEEIRRQAIDPEYFAYVKWKVRNAAQEMERLRNLHQQRSPQSR